MRLYDKNDVNALSQNGWEFNTYTEFKSTLTNKEKKFPCTLGIAGLSANQLRFGFISSHLESMETIKELGATLQSFIPCARTFGKNTSLVVFFKESRDLGIENYEKIFWKILSKLNELDTKHWPENIPKNPNNKLWEFSFSGEPIFIVCNTPSHNKRKSRYSKNFMITFQPRWVFDGVIGENAINSEKIKSEIRRRLSLFDEIPPSPDLGLYGDEENREWKQYFLKENNLERLESCPFNNGNKNSYPKIIKTNCAELEKIVSELLPPTGSVEVQYDTPFRIHPMHTHPIDETLHIINGCMSFMYDNQIINCNEGDRLLLPAHTRHSSQAGENGCTYVIATRIVN